MDIHLIVRSVRSLNGLGPEKHNYRKDDIKRCLNIALLLKKGHIEPCFEIKSKERRGKYQLTSALIIRALIGCILGNGEKSQSLK